MKDKRNQRWSVLQRVFFVVRNFKSLVLLKFLSTKCPRRRQIRHSIELEQTSNASSYVNVDIEEEENYYSNLNRYKDVNIESSHDRKISPTRNRGSIGDIIGITSRYLITLQLYHSRFAKTIKM